MTWLLVEDDNDIRNVVSVMMSVWGERPLPFPDGNAAWNWLDSVSSGTFTGELPDLALLDIRMPGHTGDKVAARIRQTSPIKDIPIILMTAFALTDTEIRTMMDETGIDLLINKPLPDMDDFRATLYRVREERRVLSAAKLARDSAVPPTVPDAPAEQPATAPTVPIASPVQPPASAPTPTAPNGTPATLAQPPASAPTPTAPNGTPATAVQPPASAPTPTAPNGTPAAPVQSAEPVKPAEPPPGKDSSS